MGSQLSQQAHRCQARPAKGALVTTAGDATQNIAQSLPTKNRFAPPRPAPMAPKTISAAVDEMLREMSLHLASWMKAAASKGMPAPITNDAIDARLACTQKTEVQWQSHPEQGGLSKNTHAAAHGS